MLHEFSRIAAADFSDIVASVQFIRYKRVSLPEKLRLHLRDGTFVDLWVNQSGSRYSFHWEHRAKRGLLHRHDTRLISQISPPLPSISTMGPNPRLRRAICPMTRRQH